VALETSAWNVGRAATWPKKRLQPLKAAAAEFLRVDGRWPADTPAQTSEEQTIDLPSPLAGARVALNDSIEVSAWRNNGSQRARARTK
jgi:hypothetical protein